MPVANSFTITDFANSPLVKHTFTEHIDTDRARRYLRSGHDLPYDADWVDRSGCKFDSVRSHLQAIVAACNRNGGKVKTMRVTYKPARNSKDNRRVFANKSLSLAQLSKGVRGYLCEHLYVDHDIVNAQPVVTVDAVDALGDDELDVPALRAYVTERDEHLERIRDVCKVDRGAAKVLVIRLMFGGGVKGWCTDNDVALDEKAVTKALPFLKGIKMDIKAVLDRAKVENPKIWNSTQTACKRSGKNANGRMLAVFMQHLERRVIESVLARLPEDARREFIYTFDGFQLPKAMEVPVATLSEWTKEVSPSVQWLMKPFEVDPDVRAAVDAVEDEADVLGGLPEPVSYTPTEAELTEFQPEVLCKFDYYCEQRRYWERFFTPVLLGDAVWMCDQMTQRDEKRGKEYHYTKKTPYKHADLQRNFNNINTGKVLHRDPMSAIEEATEKPANDEALFEILYGEVGYAGDFRGAPKFVDHWCKDEERVHTSKKHPQFRPAPVPSSQLPSCGKDYNTFSGYSPDLFDASIKPTRRHQQLVEMWRALLRELVTGGLTTDADRDRAADGMEAFLAHTVHDPITRLGIVPVNISAQGEGKGSVYGVIASLVGRAHFLETGKLDDLLGDHQDGLMNRLFVVLDEIDFKQTKGKDNALKRISTADYWWFNPKGIAPFQLPIFANVLITTNDHAPVKIDLENGDRRYLCFWGTGKFKGSNMSRARWAMLHEGFDEPAFHKCLFDYLRGVFDRTRDFDWVAWKCWNSRRKPYRELAAQFVPDIAIYLQELIESGDYLLSGRAVRADGSCNTSDLAEHSFRCLCAPPNSNAVRFDEHEWFSTPMQFNSKAIVNDYRRWAESNKYRYSSETNNKGFYNNMAKHKIPQKQVKKGNNTYLQLTMRDVYLHLWDCKYIDIDHSLSSWVGKREEEQGSSDAGDELGDWALMADDDVEEDESTDDDVEEDESTDDDVEEDESTDEDEDAESDAGGGAVKQPMPMTYARAGTNVTVAFD